jgi:hypothetical protein
MIHIYMSNFIDVIYMVIIRFNSSKNCPVSVIAPLVDCDASLDRVVGVVPVGFVAFILAYTAAQG